MHFVASKEGRWSAMMSLTEVARPGAVPSAVAEDGAALRSRHCRFLGSEWAFFRLLARGALFLSLTLGIYRFWLATDVRRFLWGHTEIAGDSLEYSGTARELLLGFLMAIALLAPVYALFAMTSELSGWAGGMSGLAGLVLLGLLGQFAVYRARRYRLTRTVYRGVRLHQTGSAVRYAVLAAAWFLAAVATAGLAWPWGQASLERYKMRHTFYGNLGGAFVGSGGRLFLRGALLWAIVMLPFLAGIVVAGAAVNWSALADAFAAGHPEPWAAIEMRNPDIGRAAVVALGAVSWAAVAAALLYPALRTMVLRWWISGLRIGDMSATSHLRSGQIYRAYLRFVGYCLLLALAAGVLAAAATFAVGTLPESVRETTAGELAAVALFLGVYVLIALGYSTIYQATVTVHFWRLSFETVELAGLAALENVRAAGAASSAFGEGLADALDVSGL